MTGTDGHPNRTRSQYCLVYGLQSLAGRHRQIKSPCGLRAKSTAIRQVPWYPEQGPGGSGMDPDRGER